MGVIRFFCEDIDFKVPFPVKTRRWLKEIIENEGFNLSSISYIFCSDDYLLKINQEYLDHDYYTDIITFDTSEEAGSIEGDIFISVDRVRDNATSESVDEVTELRRVLAHGILHLCGTDDKTEEDKKQMRAKEDFYLAKYN